MQKTRDIRPPLTGLTVEFTYAMQSERSDHPKYIGDWHVTGDGPEAFCVPPMASAVRNARLLTSAEKESQWTSTSRTIRARSIVAPLLKGLWRFLAKPRPTSGLAALRREHTNRVQQTCSKEVPRKPVDAGQKECRVADHPQDRQECSGAPRRAHISVHLRPHSGGSKWAK